MSTASPGSFYLDGKSQLALLGAAFGDPRGRESCQPRYRSAGG